MRPDGETDVGDLRLYSRVNPPSVATLTGAAPKRESWMETSVFFVDAASVLVRVERSPEATLAPAAT